MNKEEVEALLRRYSTKTRTIDNGRGYWSYLDVDILLDNEKIGSYRRNYSTLFDTFVPFFQDGQVYALYSRDYTATRLMRLPECEDIGGEERHQFGFCPTAYYVPYLPEQELVGKWGFISGCIWGDDSTWKVQYLDLSRASEGILQREERFGYLPIPRRMSLKEAVNLELYHKDRNQEIEFAVQRVYWMKEGKFEDEIEDEDWHSRPF